MYRFRTLGGAAVLRDGLPLDSLAAQRKLLGLLALLAVAGRRGISRDRIAAFLWPESDMERARGSLKQSLHLLRRQLGATDVVAGTAELRLNTELISSDVEEFLAAAETGDRRRAVALYGGPFLDGLHVAGAAEFGQWVAEQRAGLARLHAEALEALAQAAQQRGDHAEAAALWRRLQAADPFSARATAGLMAALEAAGEGAAALRAGRAYEALMREELGVAVDAPVADAMRQLRATTPEPPSTGDPFAAGAPQSAVPADPTSLTSGGPHAAAVPATAPPPAAAGPAPSRRLPALRPRPWLVALPALAAIGVLAWWQLGGRGPAPSPSGASIAVIPFVNTSDDAADGHFADGLTDELISTLGRVDGLRVSARTSSFALRDRGLSARAFADTLGVAAVIEGTVRRQDDRLKVTAQLVDPSNNSVLWSESFDRRVYDMIALQEEIARAIVDVLRGQLPGGSPERPLASRPDVDPEAYDLYLRGRYNWELPTRQRLEQAARYHQRAVERDPSFAAAYAALAETWVNHAIYAYSSPTEALARANVAAARALALEPDLVEALVARAYVRLSELSFDGAEADLRRALEVNPNYPWAHHFLTLHMLMTGRAEDAERHNRQALVLDPLSLPANATRGIIQAQLGNHAGAERELARALQLRSDFTLSLVYLGALQAARGDDDAALPTLQHADLQAPDYPGLAGALALTLRRLRRGAEADSIMRRLERQADTDPRARVNLAFAHGAAGRVDAAVALLSDVRWDVPALIGLRADPLLTALRADPRCVRILQLIGAQKVAPNDAGLTGT